MSVIATIHVFCESNPSLGNAVVKGLLAWATVLSGGTALGGGLIAALLALDMTRPDVRAGLINRGIGAGFVFSAAGGFLTFIVFAAKLVS
jgi:hypothetical protein